MQLESTRRCPVCCPEASCHQATFSLQMRWLSVRHSSVQHPQSFLPCAACLAMDCFSPCKWQLVVGTAFSTFLSRHLSHLQQEAYRSGLPQVCLTDMHSTVNIHLRA